MVYAAKADLTFCPLVWVVDSGPSHRPCHHPTVAVRFASYFHHFVWEKLKTNYDIHVRIAGEFIKALTGPPASSFKI